MYVCRAMSSSVCSQVYFTCLNGHVCLCVCVWVCKTMRVGLQLSSRWLFNNAQNSTLPPLDDIKWKFSHVNFLPLISRRSVAFYIQTTFTYIRLCIPVHENIVNEFWKFSYLNILEVKKFSLSLQRKFII